ncbi:MAG: adenine deaminase [Nannocystaceae bacterium]
MHTDDRMRALGRRVDQALGRERADLVVKGARLLNVITGELADGDVAICGDRIIGTYERYEGATEIDGRDLFVVPGFIDTHVHVESTLVSPAEFDRCVLPRGTTTAICDPHEIANVLGEIGLRFFLESALHTALDLRVQLSSCVPATHLETSGARLAAADLIRHRDHPQVIGLAEFMNFPGIFAKDPEVLGKLVAFEGAPIDGHAPLVRGHELNAYAACGIRNCHESTSLEEAQEKLRKGMQVLVRDGSVSKDVAALAPLLDAMNSPFVALCTDDRNPLDIAHEGHIDHLIRAMIARGAPIPAVYRAATWSAASGFGLRDRGLVAPGYRADLVLVGDLARCDVQRVIRGGAVVHASTFEGRTRVPMVGAGSIHLAPITADDLAIPAIGAGASSPVIGVLPGKILTEARAAVLPAQGGRRRADPDQDILKIAVLSRHGKNHNIGRAFVQGFGIRRGALASSVGHDSHNVCVVGSSDDDMALAVNRLIDLQGGFVAVMDGVILAELPLPLAGLMSDLPFEEVERRLVRLRAAVREGMGCPLDEPFLQLAFLPLPVIPHLKITDMGLVDVDRFEIVAA